MLLPANEDNLSPRLGARAPVIPRRTLWCFHHTPHEVEAGLGREHGRGLRAGQGVGPARRLQAGKAPTDDLGRSSGSRAVSARTGANAGETSRPKPSVKRGSGRAAPATSTGRL